MKLFSLVALTVCVIAASSVRATTLGLGNPLGNPIGDHTIGYTLWDTFVDSDAGAGFAISNAAGTTDGDLFTAALSASMTGGSAAGGGDRIYNGVGASSAAYNLSIVGMAWGFIDTITLQLKMTPPDVSTGLTLLDFFTVTLNGLPVTPVETNSGTGEVVGGQQMGVITYTWSNLNLNNTDAINVSITSPASGHVSVDAIRMDTVPEPSTYALMAIGLGFVLWRMRARFACQAIV